jgi:hypothetical protein
VVAQVLQVESGARRRHRRRHRRHRRRRHRSSSSSSSCRCSCCCCRRRRRLEARVSCTLMQGASIHSVLVNDRGRLRGRCACVRCITQAVVIAGEGRQCRISATAMTTVQAAAVTAQHADICSTTRSPVAVHSVRARTASMRTLHSTSRRLCEQQSCLASASRRCLCCWLWLC